MSESLGQMPLPGLEQIQDQAAKPEGMVANDLSPTLPDEKTSEVYEDLGGRPYNPTDEEARTMYRVGLGGAKIARQAVRSSAQDYYQAEFNLTGAPQLSEQQQEANRRGVLAVTRILAPHEFDRASTDANGDQRRLMALQRARAEKREKTRRSRS